MTVDPSVVFDLADLSVDRLAEVGGKAANLGELITGGFDVPDGFCVATSAYRAATEGRLPGDAESAEGAGVDPSAVRAAIAAAWPSARLRVTAGLGHARLLRDPDVVAEIVDFVASA